MDNCYKNDNQFNNKVIEENENYKNNYDQDEEINESELNFVEDDNEYDNNINYEEINENINQDQYYENELNYENNENQSAKKKRKRRRKKKSKIQLTEAINNNNIETIKENIEENIINETNNINNNNSNNDYERLSQSQKKKKKIKRKLDNMKTDYLALLEEKEILIKEKEQQNEKIKVLENLLNTKNINNIIVKEIGVEILSEVQNEKYNEIKELSEKIIKLNNRTNEYEKKHKIDNEENILQLNEKILEKDMIIDELTENLSKLEKEYKLCLKQTKQMKTQISNLEKGISTDIQEQINNLKSLIMQKEEQIIILTNQLNEYQSKCDDIIKGNISLKKDEQIKLLLNEVKSIRSKIQNILSFEGRIDNYEDLMGIISKLIKYFEENKIENEDIKIIFDKLKFLAENYELYGQQFYNRIIQEIFGINYEEIEEDGNNEIIEENNNLERNDNSKNNINGNYEL